MKIINLNLWGGIVYEPLIEFINKYSNNVDIFCFQEMTFGEKPQFTPVHKARENLFNEISLILKDFIPYKHISPSKHFASEGIDFNIGQVIFIRNTIKVKDSGVFRCYEILPETTTFGGNQTGSFQWVDIEIDNEIINVSNLHGLWIKGADKTDTPERITQSKIIKQFFDTKNNKKIFCGDYNLIPDGESIKILEKCGLDNLIKKYNIKSTRSNFYNRELKLGDYILISPEIPVKNFEILQDQISDHLPLMLEF